MNTLFADAFFYLAIINRSDAAHERAVKLSEVLTGPVVTTVWVLTEVGDALADPRCKKDFLTLLDTLRCDPEVTIIPPSQDLFEAGLDLYAERLDKAWSLTDCISFAVMKEMGIQEALTGDHHFEQAGFRAILK